MLWDGATGAYIATLKGHSTPISLLAFSPDSSRLASSGWYDGSLILWDGATGAHIATLEGHSDPISLLTFSPDGSRLSSGSSDHRVGLWDGATGEHIATLEGHSGPISLLTFSPNDAQLLSAGSRDKVVRSWDRTTGRLLGTLDVHDWYSSSRTALCGISISLGESNKAPRRRYHIRTTFNSIPLLWLPTDVERIMKDTFGSKSAALGCDDRRVIILDLSKLNVQEIV